MKKWILVLLMFSSSLVAEPFREDPERLFDMRKAMTSMSTIKIEHARDVQRRCERESRKRGLQGFGFALESCAFWGKRVNLDVCHIIVPKKVSLVTLGHEFAHCLFGAWH